VYGTRMLLTDEQIEALRVADTAIVGLQQPACLVLELERELAATQRAKQENDGRFMRERDEARDEAADIRDYAGTPRAKTWVFPWEQSE